MRPLPGLARRRRRSGAQARNFRSSPDRPRSKALLLEPALVRQVPLVHRDARSPPRLLRRSRRWWRPSRACPRRRRARGWPRPRARASAAPAPRSRGRRSPSGAASRRMPAVSTNRYCLPPFSSRLSTASRVVPGMARDDRALLAEQPVQERRLPHVGPARPARGAAAAPPLPRPPPAARRASASSSRSPTPWPCSAESGTTRSKPEARELAAGRRRSPSTLLTATITVLPALPQPRGDGRVVGHAGPARPSTTSTTRSASAIARSAWSDGGPEQRVVASPAAGRRCRSARRPRPATRPGRSCGRGWSPGRRSVIALRRPQIRLKSVDLPTLGRPTRAISGESGTMCTVRLTAFSPLIL